MDKSKEKVWTVKELVVWGTDYFAGKGIESPRLTVELMLCNVLNAKRIDLYLNYDKPMLGKELEKFKQFVVRKAKREPLQYILGTASFLNLELEVNPSVMIPRPETELLVDAVFTKFGENEFSGNILDIGTGSGCIAIALAKKYPNAKITAMDFSESALSTAKSNSKKNNIENISFLRDDILNFKQNDDKYDIVVSNPPYIPFCDIEGLQPEVKSYEPHSALTDNGDGLKFYKKFSDIFPSLLSEQGNFFIEIGHGQFKDISKLFADKGIDVFLKKDFAGLERIVHN